MASAPGSFPLPLGGGGPLRDLQAEPAPRPRLRPAGPRAAPFVEAHDLLAGGPIRVGLHRYELKDVVVRTGSRRVKVTVIARDRRLFDTPDHLLQRALPKATFAGKRDARFLVADLPALRRGAQARDRRRGRGREVT